MDDEKFNRIASNVSMSITDWPGPIEFRHLVEAAKQGYALHQIEEWENER